MRTRRNRKGGENFFGLFGSKSAQAQPPVAQPPVAQPPVAQLPEPQPPQGQPPEGQPPQAQLTPDAQLQDQLNADQPTGVPSIDEGVKAISKVKGFYARSILNAIGICNTTIKMSNSLNPSKAELFKCGEQCKTRANQIRDALNEVVLVAKDNDAIGYIGSSRVAMSTAEYLGNSAMSSLGKTFSTEGRQAMYNAPSSLVTGLYNAPSKLVSNAIESKNTLKNYFYPSKTPTPTSPTNPLNTDQSTNLPSQGGRRRRRTRRQRR